MQADLERPQKGMEKTWLVMQPPMRTIEELPATQMGPKYKDVVFMPKARRELEANEGKPKWARVLAGVLGAWV